MSIRTAWSAALLGVLGVLGLFALPVFAQVVAQDADRFNERLAPQKRTPEDAAGIWVLDFRFKDPRVMTVDIPGRGRRLVWYLWYQVSNATPEPRMFNPRLVWVCHDRDTVHTDQVLPKAQLAVQRLEDPDNLFDIKNSQTMTDKAIPVSKERDDKGERIAFPKLITGVATWDNIDPKSTQFSIYVYGLSDGWSVVDGPDGKPIVRVKTLQLKFRRLGDEHSHNSGQIRFLGHEWIYAPSELPHPSLIAETKLPAGEKKEPEKKPAPPSPPSGQPEKKP